jgi:hypothetical protein
MTRAIVAAAAPLLAGRGRRAAEIVMGSSGALVEAPVRVVATAVRRAMAVPAPPLLITALVNAATGAGRPGLAASLAPCCGASGRPSSLGGAQGLTLRPPAAIAKVTLALVAASLAPAIILVGELLGILGSHVPHGHNDDDEDYHDNDGQDEHELSHRTIQQAWPHRVAQARHTRPSTRVFPLFASTLDRLRNRSVEQQFCRTAMAPVMRFEKFTRTCPRTVLN